MKNISQIINETINSLGNTPKGTEKTSQMSNFSKIYSNYKAEKSLTSL